MRHTAANKIYWLFLLLGVYLSVLPKFSATLNNPSQCKSQAFNS